jgi:proline iminopeptidase
MKEKLFPKTKPFMKGYFKVTDGHQLYYEVCGNPEGKPVLFVHGGPGAGFNDSSKRFFNPKKFKIILFDQRGAGRSKPFASTKANTTQKLVEDMKKLLKFLGVKKTFLFGGSWGSTLSLIFAIKNPKLVNGILLRGIYLARKWDTDYTFGGGAEEFFPDSWERFISLVPKKNRKGRNIINYYVNKMKSKNKKTAKKYAYEWSRYELSMISMNSSETVIKKDLKFYNYVSLSILEAHYLKNNCFVPENYILNNAKKLKMPVIIIQGRHDVICPPIQAYLLHKAIKQSKLFIVNAAHASSEPEIQQKLLEEMNKVAKNRNKNS